MSVSNFEINYSETIENNEEDVFIPDESRETYSLRIITDWLKKKNINYKYSDGGISRFPSLELYHHGIKINVKNNDNNNFKKEMSIQTNHLIAGCAFAETLLLSDIMSDKKHKTPEDLFKYIVSFL